MKNTDDSNCTRCNGLYVIGRKAEVVFSGILDGLEVEAKIDTGAYTGGLHTEGLEEKDGILRFRPIHAKAPFVEVAEYRKKWVKSSTGIKRTRYVVVLPATVDGVETMLELTLADRSKMTYDLLIGRKNLANKFVVDVSK